MDMFAEPSASSIPQLRGTDRLREGFRDIASNSTSAHPVEQVQKSTEKAEAEHLRSLAMVYGSHFPARLQLERKIVEEDNIALPGLRSGNVALETLRGQDEAIDFADVFTDPTEREDVHVDIHKAMEKRLGIQIGRV